MHGRRVHLRPSRRGVSQLPLMRCVRWRDVQHAARGDVCEYIDPADFRIERQLRSWKLQLHADRNCAQQAASGGVRRCEHAPRLRTKRHLCGRDVHVHAHRHAVPAHLLAVSAWGEDSSATGVNGVEANDSVRDSGAVYVYR